MATLRHSPLRWGHLPVSMLPLRWAAGCWSPAAKGIWHSLPDSVLGTQCWEHLPVSRIMPAPGSPMVSCSSRGSMVACWRT